MVDCLSRGQVSSVHLSIDYATRAADQQADGDIQAFRTAKTGLHFEDVTFQDSSATLLCNVSTGRVLPMVPDGWRRRVFDAVHSLSHPAVKSSVKLVAARFFWPGLCKEVRKWAAACLACQRAKMHRPMKIPEQHFNHVHIDLVRPLPPSHGFTYLLTMVDRTTRWPEVMPLSSVTSTEVAWAFISTWVPRFSMPADLDRSVQFTSELWTTVAANL